MKKIESEGQIRVFNNRFLEVLTKSSPLIALAAYSPFIILFSFINYKQNILSFSTSLIIGLGGLISWTLFEYLIHRYIFHFINDSKIVQKIHFFIHGIHHQSPRDQERLIMPPLPGLIILSVFFILFKLILKHYVYAFLSGLLIGYLLYAFIHYSIHTYKPPSSFLRKLWTYHSLHHYKDAKICFGVSSPLWDLLLGTMPPKKTDGEIS